MLGQRQTCAQYTGLGSFPTHAKTHGKSELLFVPSQHTYACIQNLAHIQEHCHSLCIICMYEYALRQLLHLITMMGVKY